MIKVIPKNNAINLIKETLCRMGIINKNTKTIYPTCYLIENEQDYYIAHFKEILRGHTSGYDNFSPEDDKRLYSIIINLIRYDLIEVDGQIKNGSEISFPYHIQDTCYVSILPHREKKDYKVYHKVNMNNIEDKNAI